MDFNKLIPTARWGSAPRSIIVSGLLLAARNVQCSGDGLGQN
jgi:hypothetical protein